MVGSPLPYLRGIVRVAAGIFLMHGKRTPHDEHPSGDN
jgi:hypothetical protein